MVRWREPVRALVGVATAVAVLSLNVRVVYASCNPGRPDDQQYYHVARSQTATATGVYSYMSTYVPAVPTNGRFSYAWVFLGGPGSFQWAQIGNYQTHTDRHVLVQYAWASNQVHNLNFAAEPEGSSHGMEVTFNPSVQRFSFYIDGVLVTSVIISQWVPAGAQISSEILSLSSQMMGATSVNQVFDLNQIQYSGAWHTYNGVLLPYNSDFGESGSGEKFKTWDGACSS